MTDRVGAWLVVGLAAAMAVAGSGATQGGEAPNEGTLSPGEPTLWSRLPEPPFNRGQVAEGEGAELLNRAFTVTRRGKPGEARRYIVRRENLMLDRNGRVVGRLVTEGNLVRTLRRESSAGQWVEWISWKRFATAETRSPAEKVVLKDLDGANRIGYEFAPATFDYVDPPGDWASLGGPVPSYLMKVAAMDGVTFDAILNGLRGKFGDRLRIGDETRVPRWAAGQQIRREEPAGVGGTYQLGEMVVRVAGITRRDGVPCLLVWFSAEGNAVKQDVQSPQINLRMDGTEYFRGMLSVSLADGHVLAGELWGPVVWVFALGTGGQPAQETPVTGVLQQLSMWEVPPP